MIVWAIVIIPFDWRYLVASALLPLCGACLAAWPFWRRRHEIMGSIAGAAVALVLVIGFVEREFVALTQSMDHCIATESPCVIRPDPFSRYAAYGLAGFADIGVVFSTGLLIEERRRRRESVPWW